MPTIRDIHDTFERLISQQRKIVEALQTERNRTREAAKEVREALKITMVRAIPDIADKTMEELTAKARAAGQKHDFTASVQRMRQSDAETLPKLNEEKEVWGAPLALKAEIQSLKDAMELAGQDRNRAEHALAMLGLRMNPVTALNRRISPPVTRETKNYFSKFRPLEFLTSSAYRQGFKALRDYPAGHDYFDDADLNKAESDKKAAAEQTMRQQGTDIMAREQALTRIAALQAAYKGPEGILATVRDDALRLLTDSPQFAASLAQSLHEPRREALVLDALKLRNFLKIQENLDRSIEQVSGTIRKLDEPMSKLRKGKRNRPSKSVSMDLAKIEKGVNAQTAYAGYSAVSASRAATAVQNYQPSRQDDFMQYQNLLLIYMIMTMNTDAAYAHQTFGLEGATAEALNINMNELKPDLSAALGDGLASLSDNFNGLSESIGQIDLGQIERDIGNIGQIDVGNVDIGSVDIGSISNDIGGYSGGFDSGPSF